MANRLTRLLDQIGRDHQRPLDPDEVQLLLGWLNGSARRGTGASAEPSENPALLAQVFERLDQVLFAAGELAPGPAGLADGAEADVRRTRIRRLASAYHPDRFPQLGDWLTVRSQAVHRAYAEFKRNPDAWHTSGTRADAATAGPGHDPDLASPHRQPTKPNRLPRLQERLRHRFGHDRWLAHKLIAGIAALALLPVINLLLAPLPPGSTPVSSVPPSARPSDRPDEHARKPLGRPIAGPGETPAGNPPRPGKPQPVLHRSIAATPATGSKLPSVDEQLRQLGLISNTEPVSPVPERALARSDPRAVRTSGPVPADREPITPVPGTRELPRAPARAENGGEYIRQGSPGLQHGAESSVSAAARQSALHDTTESPVERAGLDTGLALGPIATHAVGQTLSAWHNDLEAGRLASLLRQFDANAQIHAADGRHRADRYYQNLLQTGQSLQVNLRVLRVQRQQQLWRVEASVAITRQPVSKQGRPADQPGPSIAPQHTTLWMREHGERLLITRIEQHSP
ncbi:MAG: hypothetical protein LC637_03165 [Xanthomonadaceae bacterium]|nr:hypothetical protein [Xanthomonadaceae bacterium]